jgi:hypothetical protein
MDAYAQFVSNTPSVKRLGFSAVMWDLNDRDINFDRIPRVGHKDLRHLVLEHGTPSISMIFSLIEHSSKLDYIRLNCSHSELECIWPRHLSSWAERKVLSVKVSEHFTLDIIHQNHKARSAGQQSGYSGKTFSSFLGWFHPLHQINYQEVKSLFEQPNAIIAPSRLPTQLFKSLLNLKAIRRCTLENVRLMYDSLADLIVASNKLGEEDYHRIQSLSFQLRSIWVALVGSKFERFDVNLETSGEGDGHTLLTLEGMQTRLNEMFPERIASSLQEDI